MTSSAISARKRRAFVYIYTAVFACKARPASAFVVIIHDKAFSAIGTGFSETEVDSRFAAGAEESWSALAALTIDQVYTGSSMFASDASAVINVDFAAVSTEAIPASALEAVAGS